MNAPRYGFCGLGLCPVLSCSLASVGNRLIILIHPLLYLTHPLTKNEGTK